MNDTKQPAASVSSALLYELGAPPTLAELRTTIRVNRVIARALEKMEREWPWWKRLFMEYTNAKACRQIADKLEDIADAFEAEASSSNS